MKDIALYINQNLTDMFKKCFRVIYTGIFKFTKHEFVNDKSGKESAFDIQFIENYTNFFVRFNGIWNQR